MKHAFFNLKLPEKLRPVCFFGYLGIQAVLLIRAQSSPDFVFGFQMFNASSELRIALFRQLRPKHKRPSRLVPVTDGAWQVTGQDGRLRSYRWNDRVRDGVLGTLDHFVHASYGLDAQLFRLQLALDDVARHLPGDDETEALVALVDTRKNGRDQPQLRLTGSRP
ncbi:MAG TPA: hypothetical protein VGF76_21830 [Polyangiaceae bacterium]|jgi:hypothetical protein